MFGTLKSAIPADGDLPPRAHDLTVMGRVLDGTIYDGLPYEFHDERTGADEYIPLRRRRPSVRYNLCRLVVEDSVSLLFGDGHFPQVKCEDKATRDTLAELLKAARINAVMIDAAQRGSVGSVVIRLRVLKDRIFLDVFDTAYLTPEYDPEEPDRLLRVTERRKVKGRDLASVGYTIQSDMMEATHWFVREWGLVAETWFVPQPITEADKPLQIDTERTVQHPFGFVPLVWVRNLPGGNDIDGACTFRPAIETSIEIDYQLSQAGRGLKYSSDPTLLIKEPASEDGNIVRGAANALVVSEQGDAKLLEINGTASAAVIEYVRTLRELALEGIHGNRSNADKVSAAQSGRALEMHHQPLIWLADNLRVTYGGDALLRLCDMIVLASQKITIKLRGKTVHLSPDEPLSLLWPPWFAPTESDKQTMAATLATNRQAGHISQETAVAALSAAYDIENVPAEIARIDSDEAKADARAAAQAAATQVVVTAPG